MSQAIVTESKLVAIGDAIRSKTGGSSPLTLDEMATEIANISGGGGGGDEKEYEVEVIDYDGTTIDKVRLDANEVYTLPTPPTHAGLTFVDWSCTTDIVNNQVTITDNDVMIGANYTTTSGLSEFDIELTATTELTIQFYAYANDTVGWGDGTSDTASANGFITHTYSSLGAYTITYNGVKVYGSGSNSANYNNQCLIRNYNNGSAGTPAFVRGVRISNNVTNMGNYSLRNVSTARHLILSKNLTSLPTYIFAQNTYTLGCIIIPNGVTFTNSGEAFSYIFTKKIVIPKGNFKTTYQGFFSSNQLEKIVLPLGFSVGQYGFQYNYACKHLTLSNVKIENSQPFASLYSLETLNVKNCTNSSSGHFYNCYNLKNATVEMTFISSSCFENCCRLEKIVIKRASSVGATSFRNCVSLTEIDFTALSNVPTLSNVSAFANTNNTFKIYVPDSLYSTWVSATNWSTYASQIYRASDRS